MTVEENVNELEFTVLAAAGYANKMIFICDGEPIGLGITNVEQALLDRELLEWKAITTKPNKNFNMYAGRILKCSVAGRVVLERDLLRLVLTLAGLDIHTYNNEFYKLVDQLTVEQLPTLLTHDKAAVRSAALARKVD